MTGIDIPKAVKMAHLFDLSSMLQTEIEDWEHDFLALYRDERGYREAIISAAADMDGKNVKELTRWIDELIATHDDAATGAVKIGTGDTSLKMDDKPDPTPEEASGAVLVNEVPDFSSQVTAPDPPNDIVKEAQKKRIETLEVELLRASKVLETEYATVTSIRKLMHDQKVSRLTILEQTRNKVIDIADNLDEMKRQTQTEYQAVDDKCAEILQALSPQTP